MLSAIIIFGAISIVSFAVMYFLVHSAPVGYEDNQGYHSGSQVQGMTNFRKVS